MAQNIDLQINNDFEYLSDSNHGLQTNNSILCSTVMYLLMWMMYGSLQFDK